MALRGILILGLLIGIAFSLSSGEGAEPSGSFSFPDAPGKEVLMSKCFQCHSEGMWKDLRTDRRGWEAALYRMVGRGALWTQDEINTMAGYLSTALPPQENTVSRSRDATEGDKP
jgi:hypothetical protein